MKRITLCFMFGALAFQACKPKTETGTTGATQEPAAPAADTGDPLPSWNDGPVKQSILSFVKKVTDSSGKDYIPVADRIATFDNDGTLWCEEPTVQIMFAMEQIKKMVEANPALAKKEPFKAVLEHDKEYFKKGGEEALAKLVALTHTGTTEDAFEARVKEFTTNIKIPPRNVGLRQITYQPQLELLHYLRANGFTTYICTGGTIEFVRCISSDLYGIPKSQVIGTTFKYAFVDSNRTLVRKPEIALINDKGGKPVGIQQHIGQRPVLACGNERSGGDIQMLMYSQSSTYPSLQLLVNHDDAAREAAYQEPDSASLKAAAANGWQVISMQKDWKTIFVQ
jgi:hypothetical protein